MPRRTFKDTILYNEQTVKQRYGIAPAQITDLKALIGDPSDNIPGITGIGEKTATKLIQQYGSIEEIYVHIEQIAPSKLQTTLRQYQSRAFQNKELVTIVRDVPINLRLESCQVSAYDRAEVVGLFRELEFIKLLPRLPHDSYQLTVDNFQRGTFQIINTELALSQLLNQLKATNEIAIDLETALTPPLEGKGIKSEGMAAKLVGIAISPASGKVFYMPLGHRGLNQPEQLPQAQVIEALKPILEAKNIEKLGDGDRR